MSGMDLRKDPSTRGETVVNVMERGKGVVAVAHRNNGSSSRSVAPKSSRLVRELSELRDLLAEVIRCVSEAKRWSRFEMAGRLARENGFARLTGRLTKRRSESGSHVDSSFSADLAALHKELYVIEECLGELLVPTRPSSGPRIRRSHRPGGLAKTVDIQ